MKKIISFIMYLVEYFTPEEYDCDIGVKKVDGIIRHMAIPDNALGIHKWYNLYYETSTKTALPFNCMDTIRELSKLKHWRRAGRKYITTHEWIGIFHSESPVDTFIALVSDIEKRFTLTN